MKKHFLFVALSLISFQWSFSQATAIIKESWTPKPTIHKLNAKYSKESAVVIFSKVRIEYLDAPGNEINEYYTLHQLIHINDDRGIESYNKIYLGFAGDSDLVDVRARTIFPGGKTVELDKSNIKEIKDDKGNTYKIFAVEGLEKGCEVEYYYTYKKPTSFFGRETLQGSDPAIEAGFKIIAPKRLIFEVKSYNFDLPATDTIIGDQRIVSCLAKDIPSAEEEKYAYYRANLRRVEYKLSYNTAVSKDTRLFTWNEMAKRACRIYSYYSDRELRKVSDLVNDNGWNKLTDEVSKIKAVENYVKQNFTYDEQLNSEDANELTAVMQNKTAGIAGIMRLYTAIFKNLNVDFQYVLTGDRGKYYIDKDFENWDNCDYPLFYFPAENKFIAPTRIDYRYPWIDESWCATNGLFCKQISLGSLTSAIAEVKTIPMEDYRKTYQDIEAHLELNSNHDSLTIDEKQIFAGYAAVPYRDAFNFGNEDQKREIIKELTKAVANSENILFSKVVNPEFDKSDLPLILHTKTKSGELIEKAGNKLLLKIGMAIGEQTQMYQEKPRQQPVDFDFGHIEERKLDFVIPDGYTITNPDDLKINQTYSENGQETMGFVSDYTIKGNILSIHIVEQYTKAYYPISEFKQFQKIINSSADFNKVVLVLQKKI